MTNHLKKSLLFFLFWAVWAAGLLTAQTPPNQFVNPKYELLPLGAIKPTSWLRAQLMTMRNGSTGHIDEIYDRIKNDNGWLGGAGDGGEETPYWLDGAVPLAYLLGDSALTRKVSSYINWTIDHQRPSGYFGPITKWEKETGRQIEASTSQHGEDWWPKMIILKVIQQHYSATKDVRVIPFLTQYFKYQQATLKVSQLGFKSEWAKSRGIENSKIAQWLYQQTKDKSLLILAEEIKNQAFPWSEWLGSRDWVINAAVNPDGKDWMQRHGVNVGMGLKDPVINYQRTGNEAYLRQFQTGFNDLMTLHGLPNGIFSADEDLHGNRPSHGTELCAIVETMYSLEDVIAITGDLKYADALERMTFNAMPSQTTDNYHEKQYFQMANQVEISRGVFDFTLPFGRGMNNVLGAKSGYTCCYANMHQGWPKFAQNLWYRSPNEGLTALLYAPNQVETTVGKRQIKAIIEEKTDYPFDGQITFKFNLAEAVEFPFQFRIPVWCKQAMLTLNGQNLPFTATKQLVTLNRKWESGDVLMLRLPMEITMSQWAENSKTVERGPLVYALKMKERWEKSTEKDEGDYYSVFSESSWNYGLLKSDVQQINTTAKLSLGVFSTTNFQWNLANAPLQITLKAKKIPVWKTMNGVAHLPVSGRDGLFKGPVEEAVEEINLVPIGFTKLRIVAFPVVR